MIGLCRSSPVHQVLLASAVGRLGRSPFAVAIVRTAATAAASSCLAGLAAAALGFLRAVVGQGHHSRPRYPPDFLPRFESFAHFGGAR